MEQNQPEVVKNRFFPGWMVAVASAAVYVVVSGATMSFSVFINPMTEDLGSTKASMVVGIGILIVFGGILAVVTGHICDRRGPRLLSIAGGLSLATGFFLTSRITEMWQFYLTYGLFAGIGLACTFVPLTATIGKWFTLKRGTALGLFYAGGGIGGLILAPVLQNVVDNYDWRTAWLVLSVLAVVIIIPAAMFLKKDPGSLGLRPLGETEDTALEETQSSGMPAMAGMWISTPLAARHHTFKEALRSKYLWILCAAGFLTFAGLMTAQVNMVPHAEDRAISASTAALALGLMSGFNAAGRFGIGAISDRLGTRLTLFITVLVAAITLYYLIAVNQAWMIFLFAIPFGIVNGGCLPLLPRAAAELFGTKALGAIAGVVAIFASIGPAFGPAIGALIRDRTGSYFLAFLIAGICITIGLVLFMMLEFPRKPLQVAQAS